MDFDRELIQLYPYLRRYALSLCRNADLANDLVQETMRKAIEHAQQFQPGTNLRAWTTVILHNSFRTEMRQRRRKNRYFVPIDGHDVSVDAQPQFYAVALSQAIEWMRELSPEQLSSLQLVGMGEEYEDTAKTLNIPVGTVKSRVHRGRAAMRAYKPE